MKKAILAAFVLLANIPSVFAGEGNLVRSTLKSAMVYRSGAELVHTAKAQLSQGNNELIIDGISNRIDMNSIRVGTDGSISILSVEFSTDYLRPIMKSTVVAKLEDSLESASKELAKVQVQLKTNKELLELLRANKEIKGTQTGLSVAELMKLMEYYKTKALELENEIGQYREKETRLSEVVSKIKLQIREEEQKNIKTSGKLLLKLLSPVAGTYNFNVSYITPSAYWNPSYDVKVENINKPVSISYKAKLIQTTGFDWKDVKLSLATSTPSQHGSAPVFQSWFLTYIDPVRQLEDRLASNTIPSMLEGKAAGVQVEDAVVTGYGVKLRGINSVEKASQLLYIVNGTEMTAEEFNRIDPRSIKNVRVIKEEATPIYGARASNGAVVVTLKDGLDDYITVNDNELNVTFDIDIPYDVPTNGKEQNVTMKEFSVPAVYKYYCAPRLDKESYLLAELPDWESLNLLPGEANIIFENTYVGKTLIDPNSTLDTMNLTLGNDRRVVVKREKLKDFSSVKFLGSNKKQTLTYEITVKNNKKEKVQMILKDQYPISTNKEIEVEVLESNGAINNPDIGVLTWKLELNPGESKKYRISYSVKYPKDKMVNLN